jgi:hypothetical protein
LSAEFFVNFTDPEWELNHEGEILAQLKSLGSFVKLSGNEIWLRGQENASPQRFPYDVRIFVQADKRILLEVSAHPKSVEEDLKSFFSWLRKNTPIQVVDEDGELSGW